MHPNAIIRAQQRFNKAKAATEAMKATSDPYAIQAYWGEFLFAVSGVYSMLRADAKGNGWSSAWVERKLKERHDDPLLSYLHHARDAEEHGIEAVTGLTNSHVKIPPGGMAIFAATAMDEWTVIYSEGGEVEYPLDRVRLVAVVDKRYGTRFEPPETHLGTKLTDRSPPAIAALTLVYLEGLVRDAMDL